MPPPNNAAAAIKIIIFFIVLRIIGDQNLLNAIHDFSGSVVGLYEIVGGAEPLGFFHVVFLSKIRENNHRSFPYFLVNANLSERFKTVYARQNKIKQYQMRLLAFGFL